MSKRTMPNNKIQQITINAAPSAANGGSAAQSLSDLVKSLAPSGGQSFPDALLDLSRQLDQVKSSNQNQADVVTANTQALTQNTAAQGSGKGIGAAAGNAASSLLGNVLGALPLVSSLTKLFSGGTSAPPPLVRYAPPAPIQFEAAQGQAPGGIGATTRNGGAFYDQFGQPRSPVSGQQDLTAINSILGSNALRTLSAPVTSASTTRDAVQPTGSDSVQGTGQSGQDAAPQITIQVQAMDSRSFLDHSHDIAQAVREAMLNMHALNDVVNDL
ncbi:MAG: hypothetical protein ACR2I2_11230 [Bryobacteraceae bacterium]